MAEVQDRLDGLFEQVCRLILALAVDSDETAAFLRDVGLSASFVLRVKRPQEFSQELPGLRDKAYELYLKNKVYELQELINLKARHSQPSRKASFSPRNSHAGSVVALNTKNFFNLTSITSPKARVVQNKMPTTTQTNPLKITREKKRLQQAAARKEREQRVLLRRRQFEEQAQRRQEQAMTEERNLQQRSRLKFHKILETSHRAIIKPCSETEQDLNRIEAKILSGLNRHAEHLMSRRAHTSKRLRNEQIQHNKRRQDQRRQMELEDSIARRVIEIQRRLSERAKIKLQEEGRKSKTRLGRREVELKGAAKYRERAQRVEMSLRRLREEQQQRSRTKNAVLRLKQESSQFRVDLSHRQFELLRNQVQQKYELTAEKAQRRREQQERRVAQLHRARLQASL